jgi:hypothetical protein
MTVIIPATNLRSVDLGTYATKDYTLSATETASLFTVTGVVCLMALAGAVTTAITVANTVKLQASPTGGSSQDLCAATDLGTTDTPVANLIGIAGDPDQMLMTYPGVMPRFPALEGGSPHGIFLNAGTIDIVTTGGPGLDGVITWHLCYVPVTASGKVEAV